MPLAGRAEVILDAEMKLDTSAPKPGTAAGCEHRRLRDLRHTEDICEEVPRVVLTTAGHGQLHVM